MVLSDNQDGLIFVWGNFGKKLEKKDKKRLLAIAQNNPDFFLNTLYDMEVLDIIDDINETGLLENEKTLLDIIELNDNHNLFKEINEFFTVNPDNLSTGSLLTGNLDKTGRFAQILKQKNENIEGE